MKEQERTGDLGAELTPFSLLGDFGGEHSFWHGGGARHTPHESSSASQRITRRGSSLVLFISLCTTNAALSQPANQLSIQPEREQKKKENRNIY